MTDPPPKRRGPWPEPIVVERRRYPQVGEHTHRQPRWPIVSLAALVLLLTAAVIVLTFYVVDLSRDRDAEVDRIQRSVGQAVCDVLDRLPPGQRLDLLRADYGCGPGSG